MEIEQLRKKAVELREQGYTYPQISEALDNKITVSWMRRNMTSVNKGTLVDPMIEELIQEAIKPEGCSNYKAQGIVYKHKQEKVTYDMVKQYKTKAKKIEPKCLFLPAWIDMDDPVKSHKDMNQMAHDLYEHIQYVADRYLELHPTTSRAAVITEIVALSNAHVVPETLSKRLTRNSDNIEKIMSRKQGDYNFGMQHPKPAEKERSTEETDLKLKNPPEILSDSDLDDIWK